MDVEDDDSIEQLLDRGLLWCCRPAPWRTAHRQLKPLQVVVTAPPTAQQNYPDSVCLTLADDDKHGAVISQVSAAVFDHPGRLGRAVPSVARRSGMPAVQVWRHVGSDLVTILDTGTGFVAL